MTTLLTAALRNPFIRTWSTRSTRDDRRRPHADLDRRPARHAAADRRQDGPHERGRLVAGGRGRRATACAITASVLGGADRGAAECRSRRPARLGSRPVPPRSRRSTAARIYGLAETGYGRAPVRLVARDEVVRTVRVGKPLVERVVVSSALALPVVRGQQVGEVRVFAGGRLIARTPLVAAESVSAVGTAGKARWYARRTVHHLVGLVS